MHTVNHEQAQSIAAIHHGSDQAAVALLCDADIRVNGERPWDIHIHHPQTLSRLMAQGSLGLGESYMQGWWDCAQLDGLIERLLRARLDRVGGHLYRQAWAHLRSKLFNLQSAHRAWRVAREHYDLGNDLFRHMLDPSMAYSCGYWVHAQSLEEAQRDKLDLICRKLQLKPGMRLLDVGCGWGSLMRFAAQRYGVECVGLTVSKEQVAWGVQHTAGLPIRFELADYRDFDVGARERFDRIASVGMFEHVGQKNHGAYFDSIQRSLKEDGLFLLHTIGKSQSHEPTDPWIEKYIFPNGELPTVEQIARVSEGPLVVEDVHNFGPDYDRTLMAWHQRFEAAWPALSRRYSPVFFRMWRYYLLACAGAFRARDIQLWQWVFSCRGNASVYRRVS
jgi:cyclopropane-fatty-acyl-phospholipid synthase